MFQWPGRDMWFYYERVIMVIYIKNNFLILKIFFSFGKVTLCYFNLFFLTIHLPLWFYTSCILCHAKLIRCNFILNYGIHFCSFSRLLQEREIIVYCDLHGHSRKQNVFIYGCENRHNPEKRLKERVFPLMLNKNAPDKVRGTKYLSYNLNIN